MRIGLLLGVVAMLGCGGGNAARDGGPGSADASHRPDGMPGDAAPYGVGHVTYTLPGGGGVFRVGATGGTPEAVSTALDGLSAGNDSWINLAPRGGWLLIETTRFDCGPWSCMARVDSGLSAGELVDTPDGLLHADGMGAISSDGALVVFPMSGEGRLDLWASRRVGSAWTAAVLLTGDSPHPFNGAPSLTGDGDRVVFHCGSDRYAQSATGLCEVATDGQSFHDVVLPTDGPGGTANSTARSPDYAPDGSTLVYEADWQGEQVWRTDQSGPSVVHADYHDDNSPCVLPDGAIASLWVDRPSSPGVHELKRMEADGSGEIMLVKDIDIADIGLGCGE
jgi:hypothetical protein